MCTQLRRDSYNAFIRWSCLQIGVPTFFLVGIYWPIGPLAFDNIPHLFEKVFASAHFLPLAAVILLGTFGETEQWAYLTVLRIQVVRYLALFLSIAYLFIYGFCNVSYLQSGFPLEGVVTERMRWTAFFSIAAAFFAFAIAGTLKILVMQEESTDNSECSTEAQ